MPDERAPVPDQPSERPAPRADTGTLVFVSHDTRDAELAEAFSRLLTSVSAGMLKSFRSSDRKGVQGIDFGVEWYPELMNKLNSACDVVCLLTPRSLNRPWILYEAGVAKGKHDLSVHGLALGVALSNASTGPFAQFQNCDDSEDSLAKLVEQLVRRLPNADPDHETVMSQVATFKERVDEILARQDGEAPESESTDAGSAKLFEEIKVMFQDLPARIESAADPRQHRSGRRQDPRFLMEYAMMESRGDTNIGLPALLLASALKDDFPWLYTMAAELYRATLADDMRATRSGYRNFMRAVESLTHGPWGHELFGRNRRELHMLLDEIPMALRHLGSALDLEGDPRKARGEEEG